jgi:hypothetical protein
LVFGIRQIGIGFFLGFLVFFGLFGFWSLENDILASVFWVFVIFLVFYGFLASGICSIGIGFFGPFGFLDVFGCWLFFRFLKKFVDSLS